MSYLCMGCMGEYAEDGDCPNCGFSKNHIQSSPYLPLKTLLSERYIVGKKINDTSESVMYIGYDKFTSKTVVLKEFFPNQLSTRTGGVSLEIPSDKLEFYENLKDEFYNLNENIAKFNDQTAIVDVLDVFLENNTVYVVEPKDEYISFKEFLERSGGLLDWDVARPLFMPVLSALSKINQSGQLHLGISAENLAISADGKMKLLNFSVKEFHKQNRIITPVFYSGSTAPEQYNENEILKEDTDIYGFTATLFYALTGKYPTDSRKRLEDGKLLISTNVVKRLPPHVISALANGLQIDRKRRVSDFENLRAQLSAAPTVKAIQEEIARPTVMPILPQIEEKKKVPNVLWGIITLVLALAIFGTGGYFWLQTNPFQGMFSQDPNGEKTTSEPTTSHSTGITPDQTYPPDSDYFKIPNFENMSYESALSLATDDSEYTINKEYESVFSDTIDEGHIVSQFPKAGETVEKGRDGLIISVKLSKGPETRKLPSVEQLSLDKVASDLAEQHFVVETVLEFSDTVGENIVIGYDTGFKEQQELKYGSEVRIVVSMGAKPEQPEDRDFSVNTNEPIESPT